MLRPDDRERLLTAGLKMLDTHRLDETVRIHDDTGKRWRWLHIISVAVSDETENSLFFQRYNSGHHQGDGSHCGAEAREKELKEKTESLSEVNTALEVLLQKREVDRMEMEEKMLTNAKSLILPYLEKLKASRMDEYQRVYLDLVESNLNEIISPLSRSMSRHFLNFTPSEIQVANLVKQGKTTKDVALILGLSARTIEAVRYTIRRKLGIKKKRSNSGHTSSLLMVPTLSPAAATGFVSLVQLFFFRDPGIAIPARLTAVSSCQVTGFMETDRRPLLNSIFKAPQTGSQVGQFPGNHGPGSHTFLFQKQPVFFCRCWSPTGAAAKVTGS